MNLSFKDIQFIIEAIDNLIETYQERLKNIEDVDEDEASDIQGKRISNPIDTVVLGFTQSTNKFKITILSQGVGLTFQSLCG